MTQFYPGDKVRWRTFLKEPRDDEAVFYVRAVEHGDENLNILTSTDGTSYSDYEPMKLIELLWRPKVPWIEHLEITGTAFLGDAYAGSAPEAVGGVLSRALEVNVWTGRVQGSASTASADSKPSSDTSVQVSSEAIMSGWFSNLPITYAEHLMTVAVQADKIRPTTGTADGLVDS